MWDETSALAPTLLVAMPQLQDPNFGKTVVLLCEHREEGAMGLVINRCTDTTASSIVQLEPPVDHDNGMPVWIGGPVDPSRGWLLINSDVGDGVEVSPGVFLSASRDLLRRVLENDELADRSRFLVGYAGWGPRQLDAELADVVRQVKYLLRVAGVGPRSAWLAFHSTYNVPDESEVRAI